MILNYIYSEVPIHEMDIIEQTIPCTLRKKKIFLIYKTIQNGAVAKSYMTNGLLKYG
jgi:hypothetical protein